MGRRIIANIVMLGFFTKASGLISADAMKNAIKKYVPRGTEELNLTAFQRGYDHVEQPQLKEVGAGNADS